jgi:hypothetical protein
MIALNSKKLFRLNLLEKINAVPAVEYYLLYLFSENLKQDFIENDY